MPHWTLPLAMLIGAGQLATPAGPDPTILRTADGKEWPEPEFSALAPESGSADDDGSRIVRGEPAYQDDARWQAQIFAKGSASFADDDPDLIKDKDNWERGQKTHFLWAKPKWERDHRCGGALIRPGWVVTAAHCADIGPTIFAVRGVRLGSLNLPQGREYRIDRVIIHADYGRAAGGAPINDIALMRIIPLRGSAGPQFQPRVIRILGSKPGDLEVHDIPAVMATGWGLTSARDGAGPLAHDGKTLNRMAPRLMRVALTVKPHSACADEPRYRGALVDQILCAGSDNGRDTCSGDSGGPLTRREGRERVLVGLVSYGRGCGLKGKQSLYVNLVQYRAWIDRAIAHQRSGPANQVFRLR